MLTENSITQELGQIALAVCREALLPETAGMVIIALLLGVLIGGWWPRFMRRVYRLVWRRDTLHG